MPTTYPIAFGSYRADIAATGAGLRALEIEKDGQAWPLTETWPAGEKPPLSAGLILAPWPNRVLDGKFTFAGVEHDLEITEPARNNASHGLVRRRDWDLVSHSESRVELTIEVGDEPGWGFPMRFGVTYDLNASGLTATHTATNIGETAAPYGFGMHSFARVGDVPLDECTLEFHVGARADLDPDRLVPVGDLVPVAGTDFDFSEPRKLAGVWLDTPFTNIAREYDGRARYVLRAPDGNGTVLWADEGLGWVQIFTADPEKGQAYPNRGRALAIEPMSCPANAFNSGTDLVILEPGQMWAGSWGIHAVS